MVGTVSRTGYRFEVAVDPPLPSKPPDSVAMRAVGCVGLERLLDSDTSRNGPHDGENRLGSLEWGGAVGWC